MPDADELYLDASAMDQDGERAHCVSSIVAEREASNNRTTLPDSGYIRWIYSYICIYVCNGCGLGSRDTRYEHPIS